MNLSIMHKGARNVYSIHRSDWQVSLCISVFQAILVLESSLEGTLLLSIEVDGHFPGNPHPAESSRQTKRGETVRAAQPTRHSHGPFCRLANNAGCTQPTVACGCTTSLSKAFETKI